MITFSIFKKSKDFYWSYEMIIYLIIFSAIGLAYVSQEFLGASGLYYNKIFLVIALMGFCSGLISKFIGFSQIEPLRGVLAGYITFKINSIEIENKEYPLE